MFDQASSLRYDSPAGWSSLVARWAHNPKVEGSNPSPATKKIHLLSVLASLQMRSWTIALFVMLPSALFGQSQGVQPIKTSSSATRHRDLTVREAHALVKAFQRDHGEDGYGLDQYEVKDYPGFQFFQAVPDPPSGRIHYPVDLRTGEVWDEGPCEKLKTRIVLDFVLVESVTVLAM